MMWSLTRLRLNINTSIKMSLMIRFDAILCRSKIPTCVCTCLYIIDCFVLHITNLHKEQLEIEGTNCLFTLVTKYGCGHWTVATSPAGCDRSFPLIWQLYTMICILHSILCQIWWVYFLHILLISPILPVKLILKYSSAKAFYIQ